MNVFVTTRTGKSGENSLRLSIKYGDAATPEGGHVAGVENELYINPRAIKSYSLDGWKPIHHDLLMLAAAIECADRRLIRPWHWCREFHITLPVSDLDIWRQPKIQEHLDDVLGQLTGDTWHFDFHEGDASHYIERQEQFPLQNRDRLKHVIAYSDGLDSCCVSGLYEPRETARIRIAGKRERIDRGMNPFDLIRFTATPASTPESSAMSRGFKFAAITAVVSQLAKVSTVIVPESGQGALGPAIILLNGVYPDYRNHPLFFRKMEKFIEELLQHPVRYKQPQLWLTKAQTIKAYLDRNTARGTHETAIKNIGRSRSCWQRRKNVQVGGKIRQCGLCAACLLRRFSLHANRVDESPDTYMFTHLARDNYKAAIPSSPVVSPNVISKSMEGYGIAGVQHFQHIADLSKETNDQLRGRVLEIAQSSGQTEYETFSNLRRLVDNHNTEWQSFLDHLGERSFVTRWARG